MIQSTREKLLQCLMQTLLLEMQRSQHKLMECCLQQSEVTVEFLQALRQHVETMTVSAEKIALFRSAAEEIPMEEIPKRRKNAVALMKRLLEIRALKMWEIGHVLGISRPNLSRIIEGRIPLSSELILKVEGVLGTFSEEELRKLFLPLE